MKSIAGRIERLEAQVVTREDYIAFAVSEGYDEAEVRAALAEVDAWHRDHPSASATEHAEATAARLGVSVDYVLRTAEHIHRDVRAYKAARGGRHAHW